ncbi:MAG: thioesterase family protein, partial [Gammaproteobacteria bacterium]|nr:thioesterase family protein [Gammaproteobacteria bacterium]
LHLVNDGVATTDDIDQALAYGPGLRWAFMGPFMTYRVAGGEGGFRHFMAQFGPSLKWPWARFDGPELTDTLLDKLAAQSDEQAAGLSIAELERRRDDCLVSVLRALRSNQCAAGRTLQRYEELLYEAGHPKVMAKADDLSRPLCLHHGVVAPEWVDYNNHMTESRYLQAFGDASDALFRYIGVDRKYRDAGCSYYTVETHLNFVREAPVDAPFTVTTQLLGGDEKRIHLFHRMRGGAGAGEDGAQSARWELATAEQMLLHVDTAAGRVCAARPEVFARLSRIIEAHAALPKPRQAGRAILPRRA